LQTEKTESNEEGNGKENEVAESRKGIGWEEEKANFRMKSSIEIVTSKSR
jgi:hypothetical protein